MADGQGDKKWYHHVGEGFGTVFRNLSGVRGLTGIFATSALIATAVAAWWYTDSSFGKFSQTLGFPLAGVVFGLWAADYYYRRDAYKKRFRDVEVSVYTTWLLIAGVEAIKEHIATARSGISGIKPTTDSEYENKLQAQSQIEAGYTAAQLTISMSYMALANLESFSKDAVRSGREKFTVNEADAGTRQQIRDGSKTGVTTATSPSADTALQNENGGPKNG